MPLRRPLSGLSRVSSEPSSLVPLWPPLVPLSFLSGLLPGLPTGASPRAFLFRDILQKRERPRKKRGACPWALHREPIGLIRPAPPSSGRTTGLSKEGWPPLGARALRTGLPGRPIFGRSHGKTLPEYLRPASPAGLPSGVSPGLPSGVSPGLPSGVSPGLPSGVSPGLPSGKAPWPACCSGLLAFFSGLPQAAFACPLGLPTRKTALFSKGGLSCDFSAA